MGKTGIIIFKNWVKDFQYFIPLVACTYPTISLLKGLHCSFCFLIQNGWELHCGLFVQYLMLFYGEEAPETLKKNSQSCAALGSWVAYLCCAIFCGF